MLRLLALASLAMILSGPQAALAQNTVLYTATYIEVGPVLAKVAAGTLRAYRDAGRGDPGATSLEVLQRIDRPNQFVVLGTWTDQKAFDAHNAGDATKKLNEKLATLLAAPNDTRQHIGCEQARSRDRRRHPAKRRAQAISSTLLVLRSAPPRSRPAATSKLTGQPTRFASPSSQLGQSKTAG